MKRLAVVLLVAGGCADDGGEPAAEGTGSAGSDESAADQSDAGRCEAAFALECPADVSTECQGTTTPVSLAEPSPACAQWTVTRTGSTAFEVGATAVEFQLDGDGMVTTCTTRVTVSDTVAPELRCPSMEVLVRPAPEVDIVPPAATVTDACAETVDVVVAPAVLGTGVTVAEYTATDPSGNVATCSVEHGVIDVFAPTDFQILGGTLLAGGQTEVTLGWEPFESTITEGVRLETAAAPDGPWSEVATLGDDTRLHTMVLGEAAYFRLVTTSSAGDGGASEPVAAYPIRDVLYDIRNVAVPQVPFPTTLYGVVRHPVALADGGFPLVIMMHGNHGNCRDAPDDDFDYCSTSQDHECAFGGYTTPNAEGLAYLAESLAVQGIVAVSVSANAMNCRDGYIFERAQLLRAHLQAWADWNAGTGELASQFEGALDLSRVGALGHSRGGDAVSNLPGVLDADPIAGLALRSVFSVAPTDYFGVEVRDTNLAVLLPSCDGDVVDLQGMRHYDRSTGFDDGVHHSQLFFIGANHNFFNTEWKRSDWEFQPSDPFCEPDPDTLKRIQQRGLSATLGPWFRTTLDDDGPVAHQRADMSTPRAYDAWTGAALDWRWSYSSASRDLIDDFEGGQSPNVNAQGQANTFADWLIAERCIAGGCDQSYLHEQWSMRLLYDETNPEPTASLALGGLDASGAVAVSFRVVSRLSSLNVGLQTQEFSIVVQDDAGASIELLLSELKAVQHLYGQNSVREVLETVRIPTAALTGLDLTALARIELRMDATPTGSVIVTDFELAGT